MFNIGGNEVPRDANAAISDLPQNKTIFIQQLTDEAPFRAEIVEDLKTVEEVFEYFKPEKEVEFKTAEGSDVTETLQFKSVGDFGKKGIINQSSYLKSLNRQIDDYQKFLKQFKSNRILQKVLENADSKTAFLAAIQAMINELES